MTQTHPTPTNQRLDDLAVAVRSHIGDARQMWAEIDPRTRRGVGALIVFIAGLILAIACAQAVFDFYRQTLGPVVWDAAHGQRDAITTVSAAIAAVIVFALIARGVNRTAGRIVDGDDTRHRSGAFGGPTLGAMAGTATGAMAGGVGGVIVGGAARGAMAGGAAGMTRPPRAAYTDTPTGDNDA